MLTKRGREGYLLIDNRCDPVPGVERYVEAATISCSHCQRQLIRNPARERERAWCSECDRYICDSCNGVRGVIGCKTFKKFMDEQDTLAHKMRII